MLSGFLLYIATLFGGLLLTVVTDIGSREPSVPVDFREEGIFQTVRHPTGLAVLVATIAVGPSGGSPAAPPVQFRVVRAGDPQAGGPAYDFRISRFEIRNDQYAEFLNDAYRHPTDPRGWFLYHDVDSGDVYINDSTEGAEGAAGPSAALTVRLYAAAVGRIRFDAGAVDPYVVEPGYEAHSVVGVSWYGAAKYCNWLTLTHDMSMEERAYSEGPSPANWHALAFDPSDADSNRSGYRLPMDGGAFGLGPYNEWHKAASARREDGELVFTARYGFGRDTIDRRDANFLESGDSKDDNTTAVGFFDGVHALADAVTGTRDTQNGYDLYDLCGNAAEWVHDVVVNGSVATGGTRGGHFLHPMGFAALRNDSREVVPAESTFGFIGFRVAQSLAPVAPSLTATSDIRAEGFAGGAFSIDRFTLELSNDASYTLDDVEVTIDVPWLELDGAAPTRVAARSAIEIPLRLSATATSLSVSPRPSGSLSFIPRSDVQEGGPSYDYWISTTEVTNDQFVVFLNDSLLHTSDPRGAYMYHDVDSGNVYLHAEERGQVGTGAPSEVLTTLLYDSEVGRIHYAGGQYAVEENFGLHPVVGVTWHGAVKYCNWLTLFAGLPAGLRAYAEGPTPQDWRPVTVEAMAWQARGIADDERAALVRDTVGYRLPMDHGVEGAAPFNEWYKAASARTDYFAEPAFDAVYGFGRDSLTPADANYFNSGDTAADSTSPFAFFDGVNTLADETTSTTDTANRYALYDLCGNVAEWTADFFTAGDTALRSVRGGSWMDADYSDALKTTGRVGMPPDSRNNFTGFRVVRGTGHVATVTVHDPISDTYQSQSFVLDLREPLEASPRAGLVVLGTYCDDFAARSASYVIENRSASPMPWAVRLEPSVDWLAVSADESETLAPSPDGTANVDVATNALASRLPPGEHRTDLILTNSHTNSEFVRPVSLQIAQPISVHSGPQNPESFTSVWKGNFDALASLAFTLSRSSGTEPACALDYAVSTQTTWLSVVPVAPTSSLAGPLPASSEVLSFDVQVNIAADDLTIGQHEGEVLFSFLDPLNADMTPPPIRQKVFLTIEEPLTISSETDPWVICCRLPADAPPNREYQLTNRHPSRPMPVIVQTDVPWLQLDVSELTVLPGATAALRATVSAVAPQTHGEYPASLTFTNVATGQVHTREVTLRILENLSITPLGNLASAGKAGAGPAPTHAVYTLRNLNVDELPIDWEASADQNWVSINGAASIQGTLQSGATARLTVAIEPSQIPPLPADAQEQTLEATVTIMDLSNGEVAQRNVFLTVVRPTLNPQERLVSGAAQQPGGPAYDLYMGTVPVTNEEYVRFLNDALAHPDDARGQYLHFDSASGDVYVNTSITGQIGTGSEGRTRKVFSPSVAGQVMFSKGLYTVVADTVDYSRHPVTGVSWYGAVKFCNWLTLDQGMPTAQKCYTEDVDGGTDGWRPVSISAANWSARDLTDPERAALVRSCRGYRLPMDDGYNNPTPSTDAADAFNEWYKGAAWNPTSGQNRVYGFGRNTIAGADANFRCSGDVFENPADCTAGGTTPGGYFDGTTKENALVTRGNENGFGLFDMTGNTHQWLQDRYAPGTLDRRTIRGGSFNDAATSTNLRNDSRPLFALPGTTSAQIGFRVVRVPQSPDGDFDGDGNTDLADLGPLTTCAAGPHTAIGVTCPTFDFDTDGDVDLDDIADFIAQFDGS